MSGLGRAMTPAEWAALRHFQRAEWKNDPDRVDAFIVWRMEQLADAVGVPVHIHLAHDDSGHEDHSWHYGNPMLPDNHQARWIALAVDFHLGGDLTPAQQFVAIAGRKFNGVGWYPGWNNPGWHCDLRTGPALFWWQKVVGTGKDKRIEYVYGHEALADALVSHS